MNFWTGLILGIIIGWLVEWIIDWLFWRRDMDAAPDAALLSEQAAADRDADWQERLAAAEGEYHSRLAAVEAEWQARLELNEQQWQAQFAAIEADRATQRVQLSDAAAVATLSAAVMLPEIASGLFAGERPFRTVTTWPAAMSPLIVVWLPAPVP